MAIIRNDLLVSCVMPTWNRRAFIPAAVDCFLKQTYSPRELVILDDGEEPIEDLLPADFRIRYVFENRRRVTGDKRNQVCELAKGEILCHWDDDDWSAENRIAYQVEMLRASGKPATGFGRLLFWDVTNKKAMIWKASTPGYVCGTSLCYTRELFNIRKFRSLQKASDNDFVYPILSQIAASNLTGLMVARIHGCHHTSSKAGIREIIALEQLPPAFYENDRLRLDAQ
jgi:glycosyltransferase involved in cell wall biosynthesis